MKKPKPGPSFPRVAWLAKAPPELVAAIEEATAADWAAVDAIRAAEAAVAGLPDVTDPLPWREGALFELSDYVRDNHGPKVVIGDAVAATPNLTIRRYLRLLMALAAGANFPPHEENQQ